MTLLGLGFSQLLLLFGVFGGLITLLYILKLRRRRIYVPFAQLWERVVSERQTDSLFRRLKRLLSLLLQLLFVALLIFALGNPQLSRRVLKERRIIVLIDASASMKTRDEGNTDRLATAVEKVRALIDGKGATDAMMLVQMDAHVSPLTGFTSDDKILHEALKRVAASDTRADLARALTFCGDALSGQHNPLLVLVGDGAYERAVLDRVELAPGPTPSGKPIQPPSPAGSAPATRSSPAPTRYPNSARLNRIRLHGIEVRWIRTGKRDANIGIVAFNARRYPTNELSFEMFLEVANFQARDQQVDLQIYADGVLNDVKRLALKANEKVRYTCSPDERQQGHKSWCDLAALGELIEARLAPISANKGTKAPALDDFALDDRAFALLPRRRKLRVLLVSRGNLFLEGALLLDENIELSRIRPGDYSAKQANAHDAVVLDAFAPAELPKRHLLLVNPPNELSLFEAAGTLSRPIITEQAINHPVMRFVRLKDVNIARSTTFRKHEGDQVLTASFQQPLIIARRDQSGRKALAIGFDPRHSDLPLRVAFPLMVINTFNWFAGSDEGLITTYRTGHTWRIPLDPRELKAQQSFVEIEGPDRRVFRAPLVENHALVYGQQVGLYKLKQHTAQLRLAANLADADESNVRSPEKLVLDGQTLEPPRDFSSGLRRDLWLYLLLIGLALLSLEWLTYNRRMTV